ncbi:MAG: hypothetical protein JNK15_17275 [Planctomycetes bacterium]|nr:hypothetical protein [Planctomycetota bacterium]
MNVGSTRARWLCTALLLLVFAAVAVRCAWLGDDAYITLRSVENWVAGNGLRWNPGDRVQTYTHPLWMLLLSAGRALTGEVYFTTIALSLLLSCAAAAVLLWRGGTVAAITAVAAMLVLTRAFTDYATSGLETPLTFVLLVSFAVVVTRTGMAPPTRFTLAVLLTALAATTRMDLGLLCAPAVLATWRGVPFATALRLGAAASLPFLGWLVFAVVWYGSPLPVTAHAKAFGLGIPAGDLAMQGLRYLRTAIVDDPVLLPVVVGGLGLGLARASTRWLALGAVLYVGYVVKVGGDFMAGRFLLPPFVVAVAVLGPWLAARSARVGGGVALAVLALAALRGVPQWLRSPASDTAPSEAELAAQAWVGDERRVYYATLGLLSPTRQVPVFGALDALVRPNGGPRWILRNGAVGVAGFQSGARGTVLDELLCDPLLARLPAKDPTRLRIGHVLRRVPEGYLESVATGRNRLRHQGLARYYDALLMSMQAPPWSEGRFAAMWQMARGDFDAGFRDYVLGDYRTPPRVAVAAGDVAESLPLGADWFDEPRMRVVYDGGLAVTLPAARRAREVVLQTSSYQAFQLRFVREGVVLGTATAAAEVPPPGLEPLRLVGGLRNERAAVPEGVGAFDTVWIDAVDTPLSHTSPVPPAIGAISFDG